MIVTSSSLGIKIEITLQSEEEVEALKELAVRSITIPYLVAEERKLRNIDLDVAEQWVNDNPRARILQGLFSSVSKQLSRSN